jgi:Family of unknown function (DUF5682)
VTSPHLFPVRHHSPRTSLVLARWLDVVRPGAVLVEGPEDATPLIPALCADDTVAPIAILGYRTDGTTGSALWPFADYSPELVALRWAVRHGVPARFIDITTGQSLAREDAAPSADEGPSLWDEIARRAGFRSFEEFWEASFEAPDYDEAAFRAALTAYADLVRDVASRDPIHAARDAFMAQRIAEAKEANVACVLGAAHVAALVAGAVDPSLLARLAPTVPTTTTLVPYSFPRLAEQTGYGAGNRAPRFYQRAWEAGGSYRRAALEVLVDFSDHLRLRGHAASLADTIEAYRLAQALTDLRGKAEPGLDEIREATIATLCRGDATHVDGFLWPSVVGHAVGRVGSKVAQSSLQAEFWREVEQRRLPRTDAAQPFALKLADPVQVGTSVFLHRLRLADVPYAAYLGDRRRGKLDDAGGVAALTRVSEQWEAQWTPATDVALVERIVLGESLLAVCQRILAERLAKSRRTGDAADVLLEAVVARLEPLIAEGLAACERLASVDDDLPSLATACRALSGLLAYGSSRDLAAIPPLLAKTFTRAVLRVRAACDGDDGAIAEVLTAMRVLHELAMAQPLVDGATWKETARTLAADDTIHPSAAGMATGLLYLAREIGEEEVAVTVARRLSETHAPERAARFLAGFLEVNALVLVKSRPVVAALDAFLAAIEKDRFRDALPVLRRAFAGLGATERRYLVENVLALRKLGAEAAQVVAARDKAQLAALGDDLAKAMDDLDDLL